MDKAEKVARQLHYIDSFFKQMDIPSEWEELSEGQRNSYLNYAKQVILIIEKTP